MNYISLSIALVMFTFPSSAASRGFHVGVDSTWTNFQFDPSSIIEKMECRRLSKNMTPSFAPTLLISFRRNRRHSPLYIQKSIIKSVAELTKFSRSTIRMQATNPHEPSIPIVEAMPPPLPPLKNHYYLLRHGQSTANVEGIISSARSLAGSPKHGLTKVGVEQGKRSSMALVELIQWDLKNENNFDGVMTSTKNIYFYSSPFSRAKETAYACMEGLKENEATSAKVKELGLDVKEEVTINDGLMERYFGRLDGMALSTYAYVWPVDMFEPTHTAFDVESVAAVSTRIRSTILDIESHHNSNGSNGSSGGDHIVLTSHADVLQITQVFAAGLSNVGMFSQYRFGNGEVRKMGRSVDTLPEAVPLQPPKRGT